MKSNWSHLFGHLDELFQLDAEVEVESEIALLLLFVRLRTRKVEPQLVAEIRVGLLALGLVTFNMELKSSWKLKLTSEFNYYRFCDRYYYNCWEQSVQHWKLNLKFELKH